MSTTTTNKQRQQLIILSLVRVFGKGGAARMTSNVACQNEAPFCRAVRLTAIWCGNVHVPILAPMARWHLQRCP
eukprot:250383-Amphidinium_carterae.1